jgi:outer membrane protein insertion porin family
MCIALSAQAFVVKNIKVIGLQRIEQSTVLSYSTIHPGHNFTTSDGPALINALYATGFFSNIELARQANNLIIYVKERPTLFKVNVVGNKKVPKKQLDGVLKQLSIVAGQIYDSSKVSTLVSGLREQYFNLGYYDARISTSVQDVGKNRVNLTIKVQEGNVAKIRAIRIIGNKTYSQRALLKKLSLSTPNLLSFITDDDQYSKQKLDADIEVLRSFYMNNGFVNMQVVSQQVSISPDHTGLSISIAISEGQRYKFKDVSFSGKTLGLDKQLHAAVQFSAGDWFSRQALINTSDSITAIYADRGYAFPQIVPTPKLDNIHHTVSVNFNIDPQHKFYIRKILLNGNSQTNTIALRNVMSVINEAALYSASIVTEAKRRLSNLPYIMGVKALPKPVPGTKNKVDLDYSFSERNAGKISLSGGYSDVEGMLVSLSVSDPNFMGTGNALNVAFQKSQYANQYSLSYTNPFVNTWGASRTASFSYSDYTPSDVDLSSYGQRTLAMSIGYGIPISQYTSLSSSLGYSWTSLKSRSNSPSQVTNFVKEYGNTYHEADLSVGVSRQNVDRFPFPTNGTTSSLSATLSAPLTDKSLLYYTINNSFSWYQPLYKSFILKTQTTLGYGNGLGSTKSLPFFKNFYAGGISTIAGFASNSLGPKDSNGDAIGGNLLAVGRVNLIFPNGISDRVRTAVGFNIGSVYDKTFKVDQTRASVGLFVTWLSPFAPIQLGLAYPIMKKAGDDVSMFGFNLTTSL